MTTTSTMAAFPKSNHSRRQFIRRTGSAALMVAAAGLSSRSQAASSHDSPEKGVVGSNIYGWTQYAQRDQKKLDVEEVIAALRDAGYDYLESFMNVAQPEENARFADQLKAKGLQPVSLYVGARLHETGKADEVVAQLLAAAKVCRQAGFCVISCNADPIGREKTEEELKTQAAAFATLGKGLKTLGMSLGLHHHMPELVNGAREFHHGFRNTKPDEVGFCYDVHWVWKGGVLPAQALGEYGNRVVTWHIRQSRAGIWWENLDSGDVDYSAVAAYAREHNLPRRFTVELAIEPGTRITRSVVENHKLSREFIRKTFQA